MTTIVTIDWETLGLDNKAPLLEMGYCIGDTESKEIIVTGSIPLTESWNRQQCRVASYGTIEWWLRKAMESDMLAGYLLDCLKTYKVEAIPSAVDDVRSASADFYSFLQNIKYNGVTQLWCTDKSFDYVFLTQALASFGYSLFRDTPLTYKDIYESRYFSEQQYKGRFYGTYPDLTNHTPVDDSIKLFRNLSNVIL